MWTSLIKTVRLLFAMEFARDVEMDIFLTRTSVYSMILTAYSIETMEYV